eukprot:scaffold14699_cov170-Amphora_coffeaeformis.AAC.4
MWYDNAVNRRDDPKFPTRRGPFVVISSSCDNCVARTYDPRDRHPKSAPPRLRRLMWHYDWKTLVNDPSNRECVGDIHCRRCLNLAY